jgi:hypothetical protein
VRNNQQGGGKMKTKVLAASTVLLFILFLVAGSFAEEKKKFTFFVPEYDEEIWGTWVNMDNLGYGSHPQKVVNYYWGSYDIFMKATDINPAFKGAMILVEKWTDKEGNIWYEAYWRENWGFSPLKMI